MLKGTLNSSLWLICTCTKNLVDYADGDELSVVYCTDLDSLYLFVFICLNCFLLIDDFSIKI